MCQLKGTVDQLDVNLPAAGSGTKQTNPSEGHGIDLTVYRRSWQQERLHASVRSTALTPPEIQDQHDGCQVM